MTREERLNLLKNACEEALKRDPEVLEGKEIIFSEKNGWQENICQEFMCVPEKEVRIYIVYMAKDSYNILISKNIRWELAAKYIKEKIRENNIRVLYSSSVTEYVLGFAVTF